MSPREIWFSHREKIYEVKNGAFSWSDKEKVWNWDRCTLSMARSQKDELIIVVRSNTNKNSKYMGDLPVKIRFMLGFPVKEVSKPKVEKAKEWGGHKDRWIFELGTGRWVWDFAEEGIDIKESYIFELYKNISEELKNPSIKSDNIFDVELDSSGEIIPVIYQPAVDSLKNFIREIHCFKKPQKSDGTLEVEVTLVFNNEELRKHSYLGILNKIYEKFRGFHYGRTIDIETFRILFKEGASENKMVFEKIYSGGHTITNDSIHGDKPPAPEHDIKYYFQGQSHPVIFINTSNHAMADHDANHRLWKWEYVPWASDAPIKFGTKSREEIDRDFESG